MLQNIKNLLLVILLFFSFTGFSFTENCQTINLEKYKNMHPKYWGEHFPGIIDKFKTKNKEIALTLDACSGRYDKELIDFLIRHKVKATLFLSGRWLDKNPEIAKRLSKISLFEVENHGLRHIPMSVNGRSAYNIKGTKNINEIFEEVCFNEKKIEEITGIKTKFFRAGTANYDDVAIKILNDLGYKVIGFSVNGDFGATASKNKIYNQVINAKPGDIILCHMNHPEKETFEGLKKAIPVLLKQGFKFVKLEEVLE